VRFLRVKQNRFTSKRQEERNYNLNQANCFITENVALNAVCRIWYAKNATYGSSRPQESETSQTKELKKKKKGRKKVAMSAL
jgi:hypothetical protein